MGIDAEMFVRTRRHLTPEQVRRLSGDLAEAFGANRFWIEEDYRDWETQKVIGRHVLEIISSYQQDGPDIKPKPGEQLIQAHLSTRYYGKGYERGDIGFIILVAMWLEVRIPGAEVWYGGDSSGVCAIHFNNTARAEHWKHFAEVGHTPYTGGFGSIFDREVGVPHCDFCDRKLVAHGGGGGDVYYSCHGCGKRMIYMNKTQELIRLEKDEDFFTGHKRLETANAQR